MTQDSRWKYTHIWRTCLSKLCLPVLLGLTSHTSASDPIPSESTLAALWPVEGETLSQEASDAIFAAPVAENEFDSREIPWQTNSSTAEKDRFALSQDIIDQCCKPHEIAFDEQGEPRHETAETSFSSQSYHSDAASCNPSCQPLQVNVRGIGGANDIRSEPKDDSSSIPTVWSEECCQAANACAANSINATAGEVGSLGNDQGCACCAKPVPPAPTAPSPTRQPDTTTKTNTSDSPIIIAPAHTVAARPSPRAIVAQPRSRSRSIDATELVLAQAPPEPAMTYDVPTPSPTPAQGTDSTAPAPSPTPEAFPTPQPIIPNQNSPTAPQPTPAVNINTAPTEAPTPPAPPALNPPIPTAQPPNSVTPPPGPPNTTEQHAEGMPPNAPPAGHLINFHNVAMTEYVRFVGLLTGKNFIYNDEDLQFTVTIVSKEPTSLANIMAALLQELRIHGLALVEQGNNLLIYKQAGAIGPGELYSGSEENIPELGTRVFHMGSTQADKIADIVTKMLSPQALVQVLADSNTLIITDLSTNIERISILIKALDTPSETQQVGQYVAVNNLINTLLPSAERLLAPLSAGKPPLMVSQPSTNSVFIVASPEMIRQTIAVFQKLDGTEGSTGIYTLEDLKRNAEALARKRQQEGAQSDFLHPRIPGAQIGESNAHTLAQMHTKFYIYKLEFRKGDQIVPALQNIAESLRLDEKANIDLINAVNSVQWLESSNSLIVTGTSDAVGRVKELLEDLDVSPRQIFLEMLIIDTSIQDSLSFSVDIDTRFSKPSLGTAEGFNQAIPNGSNLPPAAAVLDGQQITGATGTVVTPSNAVTTTTQGGTGTVNGVTTVNQAVTNTTIPGVTAFNPTVLNASALAESPGFNLGIIGRHVFKDGISFSTIAALARALHTDTSTDIVLNPKIIVEDNYPAEVFVGQTTAFSTQTVVNDQGTLLTGSVEYRDIGTKLKVTPQIGNGNIITLLIEQEVSATTSAQSVGTTTTIGGGASASTQGNQTIINPGPTTSKSHTITRVHVPDGYFVILSGMIRDERNNTRNQMPCLGGLPILGAFASNKVAAIQKKNTMIFIRPIIIDEDWQYDDITRRQQNIWKEKRRKKPRWKFEADETLDYLNLPRFNEPCNDGCFYKNRENGFPGPE